MTLDLGWTAVLAPLAFAFAGGLLKWFGVLPSKFNEQLNQRMVTALESIATISKEIREEQKDQIDSHRSFAEETRLRGRDSQNFQRDVGNTLGEMRRNQGAMLDRLAAIK